MPTFTVDKFFSNHGTRNEVRTRVVNEFLNETPGNGTGENAAKYRYYVETLADGNRIFLERPATLNKGFDFVIHVENYQFVNRKTNPRHDDIIGDLAAKKAENQRTYAQLIESVREVHQCQEIDDAMCDFRFESGYSAELLLKVIKWFFIEQDIRYWNWTGRDKFLAAIEDI
ncbi:DNA adenine methylase [Ruminococcaceae bacterium OttesenSCG-928-O06]|nr:DNA adenine methylase [Ruminococcaceae bacterium OttesenSCG-928-O06]